MAPAAAWMPSVADASIALAANGEVRAMIMDSMTTTARRNLPTTDVAEVQYARCAEPRQRCSALQRGGQVQRDPLVEVEGVQHV